MGIIKLGLVDDHKLFRKGLIGLIELVCPEASIMFEADDGVMMQQLIDLDNLPDILLLDVSMPRMDGFETLAWIKCNFPEIKVLVVSMVEKEETVIRMVKLGVRGYLCKDVEPKELGEALRSIASKGFYYTDFITGRLVHSLQSENGKGGAGSNAIINNQENKFLQLACSELTYYEIAEKMFLSPKTIDNYRNSLFEKLNVKNRVGPVLYAVKHGLVNL